jgi:hypothetical protein
MPQNEIGDPVELNLLHVSSFSSFDVRSVSPFAWSKANGQSAKKRVSTSGTDVTLWGPSPLYVKPVSDLYHSHNLKPNGILEPRGSDWRELERNAISGVGISTGCCNPVVARHQVGCRYGSVFGYAISLVALGAKGASDENQH